MAIVKGIWEVGFGTAGSGTPLGRTDQNGVSINITPGTLRIEYGDSDFAGDVLPTGVDGTITGTLHAGDLATLRTVLGLPAGALSSDVLTIQLNQIFSATAQPWYIKAPGAAGKNRVYQVLNGKIRMTGAFVVGREQNVQLQFEITILAPTSGTNAMTVTDTTPTP